MALVQLLGQLLGFAIFIGVIVYIAKHKGFHPDIFELEENEKIVKMAKGDFWEPGIVNEVQNSGEFAFTNKRVLFKGTFLFSQNINISIPYENIAEIKNSFVKIFPVAFEIRTKDGKNYKFAIMKRQIYIDLINSLVYKEEDA